MSEITFDGSDHNGSPDKTFNDGRLGGREGTEIGVRFPFFEQLGDILPINTIHRKSSSRTASIRFAANAFWSFG